MVDLALAFDALSLGLVIYDNKLDMLYCNRTARELVSVTGTRELVLDEIRELARQCRVQHACRTRLLHIKPENKQITYKAKAQALDPNYNRILVTIEDDTSTFRLERTLLKAETLTVLGQLAIDALTEIRNPLTVALGFCQLLSVNTNDCRVFLDFIKEELLAIRDILDQFACHRATHR